MPKIAYKEKYEEARKTIEALYDQIELLKPKPTIEVYDSNGDLVKTSNTKPVNEELKEDVRAMTNICSILIQNIIEKPVETADVNVTLLQEFRCVLGKYKNG